jgi:hypothetical protein
MALKKDDATAELIATTITAPNVQNQSDLNAPANLAPATEVDAAGAPQQIVPDVDMSHPAVDANPRANTTVGQNRIDFNDPTISGQEAVERALAAQQTDNGKAE